MCNDCVTMVIFQKWRMTPAHGTKERRRRTTVAKELFKYLVFPFSPQIYISTPKRIQRAREQEKYQKSDVELTDPQNNEGTRMPLPIIGDSFKLWSQTALPASDPNTSSKPQVPFALLPILIARKTKNAAAAAASTAALAARSMSYD